ncbi:MAG: hypothetical protein WCK47_11285 [bacterium]|nr:hypothetical protein [Candidatus Sumerlaeota bacterium]
MTKNAHGKARFSAEDLAGFIQKPYKMEQLRCLLEHHMSGPD